MTVRDDFDRTLTAWFKDTAGSRMPDYVDETLDAVWRLDQPARWMRPWTWLGSLTTMPRRSVLRETPVVLVVALLVLALLMTAVIVGSQRILPEPFGLAKSGLLAFEADGDIYLAEPDGTGLQVLVGDAGDQFAPSWSPDGTRLAYWSASDHRYPAELWVVRPDGSDAIAVTGSQGYYDDGPAVWSPDSGRLAFTTRTGELHVVEAGGKDDRRIGDEKLRYSLPSWSPDGTRLAARGFGPANDVDYHGYVIGVDDGAQVRVGPPNVSGIAHGGYDWSPDGGAVVFHLWRSESDLDIATARLDADGTWHDGLLIGGPTRDVLPTLSPGGDRLAFIRTDAFGTARQENHLMVASSDGSAMRTLSDRDIDQSAPCWSPDGRWIQVVSTSSVDLRPVEVLVSLDGRELEIRASGGASGSCSWQRLAP